MATTQSDPQYLTEGYVRFYRTLHGRSPRVRHMGGFWYQVNGEIVHQSTLQGEVERLRELARKQKRFDQGMIKKIIARLRGL